jgi:death-on-curing protein
MNEPRWKQEKVVGAIHHRQLAEHGGLDGLRDPGMSSSALARPLHLFSYGTPKPDLPTLAAAYALGIIKDHPFVDGNKRTAYVTCRTFLKLNDFDIEATDVEKYDFILRATEGTLTEGQFAKWLRSKRI